MKYENVEVCVRYVRADSLYIRADRRTRRYFDTMRYWEPPAIEAVAWRRQFADGDGAHCRLCGGYKIVYQ